MKPLTAARLFVSVTLLATVFASSPACADIRKIYHPYVEPLEKELEFIGTHSYDAMDNYQNRYLLGYGQSLTDNFSLELSALAEQHQESDFDIEAYELEGLYQLSEQGAQTIDYGLLIELERETKVNISEMGATLLLESELGDTSLTANLGLAYEFGSGIDNEYDRSARLQWRYRYRPALEPALELYLDEYDKAAGPALMGLQRLGTRQKLRWELGLLFALEKETPDTLLRAALEFEF